MKIRASRMNFHSKFPRVTNQRVFGPGDFQGGEFSGRLFVNPRVFFKSGVFQEGFFKKMGAVPAEGFRG